MAADGTTLEIAATSVERARLALRLGIEALERLEGRARIEPRAGGRFRLHVDFVADVLQSCVVTLEPVSSRVEGQFDVVCAEETDPATPDVFVEPEGEEPPEPIVGGQVDVGELLVQYLALEIDPYPRQGDASVPADYRPEGTAGPDGSDADGTGDNPFAALAALKHRRNAAGQD